MNKEQLKQKAIEVMNEDPNKFMPAEIKNNLDVIELRTKRVDKKSNNVTRVYGGGVKALITVTDRPRTADQSEDEIINEIYTKLSEPPSPQCKKLFQYDDYWRNVENESDYTFAKYLELIIKNDGYELQPRFE